jgi:RNA polymerase sigma-70 factor (ECF subfamily)
MADEFDADVERALAALPPDFRAAVVLCDIEQLSYEEIAATLNVKLGTVRSRISRGRAMLRAALDHRAPERAGDRPDSSDASGSAVPVAPRAAPTAGDAPDGGQEPAGDVPGEAATTPVGAR